VLGALIFSGYILVDTQLVMRHYHVEEEIAASISLYLDVLNLFMSILRILNGANPQNGHEQIKHIKIKRDRSSNLLLNMIVPHNQLRINDGANNNN
jgi:hypothetical protein